MADCIFCGIVAGDVPATIVDSADRALAFEDVNPRAPVHVLVVPREHLTDVHAVRDGELLVAMFDLARKVARDKGVGDSGYRLVFNSGPDAGQTVFHAHLHVLGGRALAWPPG
jgi:histidine triad (HIT) family protein